jgi:hypothetical protein
LHEVDEKELIAGAGKVFPLAKKTPAATKVLGGEDLSALFGLDITQGTAPDTGWSRTTPPAEPNRAKTRAGQMVPAVPRRKGKVRAQGSARRRKQSTASRESSGSKKK